MVSVGHHPNITLLSYSEVEAVSGYVGNFNVLVRRKARFIDESKCTGCGNCATVCPINVSNPFDFGLSSRKATYRVSAQAVPGAFCIEKTGIAPCRDACPTDQHAQGYIALIRQKRYADAYWAIRREHPFPSVCGRVCNHVCEDACSRSKYDDPVNIMALKRFVTDWAYEHRQELADMQDKSIAGTPFLHKPPTTGKKVAVIGAGPAGLTAALDLVRLGHQVVVFDGLPVAGGMMRVGIPPHRLSYDMMDWEIQQIQDEGVEIRLNTYINDIPSLLSKQSKKFGAPYDAVLIATGTHVARKLDIPNADHPDNILSLDLLRHICLGLPASKNIDFRGKPVTAVGPEAADLKGKKVAVLGAGNVALDCIRSLVRMGAGEVKMICRKPRDEVTGYQWEVDLAEEEGAKICDAQMFKEIVVEKGRISGVKTIKTDYKGYDANGRIMIDELPGTEQLQETDVVVWATGQGADLSYLPGDGSVATTRDGGIAVNSEMMTTLAGVFSAGDGRLGKTTYVVDAIGEGHKAARCIDRHLRGENGLQERKRLPVAVLDAGEIEKRIESKRASRKKRVHLQNIPVEERVHNFKEVEINLTEEEAVAEAERCLGCGVCSECLECVVACDRGAIDHDMCDQSMDLTVGAIILATGFKDFDPRRAPELKYGKLNNVLTAMEFERLINASGPTQGKVLLKNGKPPKSVAVLHCVGSRDSRYNEYCSRACCMYSLKLSQLVHEYVGAEVHEIYRDMRSFGKGYEEFYNRTARMGIHFNHGRVKEISKKGSKLLVSWDEAFHNQPSMVEVDMVILATGFEPQADTARVASTFGVSRSRDGFFLERHPKLAPIETTTDGIYLAGTCQAPKDIPDSVAQASGAAAAALSLIDQGVIYLDPAIAEVNIQRCAGCGMCVTACPYKAIELVNERSQVNGYLCKGCGTCAAACPNKAITLLHFDDREIVAEILGALSVENPAEVK